MPVDDWQFWLVTFAALGAAALVLRPFLPRRGKKDAGCAGCPSGEKAAGGEPKPKRVDLTIGGKRVRR